jgi:succinate dehydrogenase / fumarate reductase cytochrome b subunit
MASAKPSAGTQRPISPHLQIYSPLINMMMSIIHRITGVALYGGTLLLAFYLVSAASGPEAYYHAKWIFGKPIGLFILFGYTWALFHHMLGGIRHLIWDTGAALQKETASKLAWATVAGSLLLTAAVWLFYFLAG